MENKNNEKQKNNEKNEAQQEPLSGSKKVKNKNHSRQKNNPGHGM